ncbi:MAG: glutamate racemase [Treponemataceae bacterium]|nr:glutamate racemase [Treponemataceae bacterium]
MSVDFAFIDSGTGGLPYMKYLMEKCPDASCIYVADAKNFPYGEKTPDQVKECAIELCKKVIENFNPKVIVIACNTISVTALQDLRNTFSIPFIGTVPAIKLAAKLSKNRRIGLLATQRSVSSAYTARLIRDFAGDCAVFSRADGKLINFIEKNLTLTNEDEKLKACANAVEFFKENECDTIILGCTHFIHLAGQIQKLAGPEIQVIDSRDGVVRQAIKMRGTIDGSLPQGIKNQTFFVTGYTSYMNEKDYKSIADSIQIPWGGIIN